MKNRLSVGPKCLNFLHGVINFNIKSHGILQIIFAYLFRQVRSYDKKCYNTAVFSLFHIVPPQAVVDARA